MRATIGIGFALGFAVALAACGGAGTHSAPLVAPGLQATTTLAAETGNNTSTADSFAPQANGNAGAGNVSKLSVHSLLYAGATTKVFVHLMPWFDGTKHMNVGYNSGDPAQVRRQVEDMISRGLDGAVVYWAGPNNQFIDNAVLTLKQQAEAHPGFQFAVSEDSAALNSAAAANNCAVTDELIADLNYIANQFETSPAYLRINGQPVVFFFGQDSYYVDWNRVQASVLGSPLFLFRGSGGLMRPQAQGGFQWVDINSKDPLDPQLTAQDTFYSQAVQTPGRVVFGSAYKGFNDALAPWGLDRIVSQRCGQTWLATFAEIAKFYSAAKQLSGLQLVTWNDYEEGTAIEPGIDNCVYVAPTISGKTLSWTVGGGSENSIDHYTVFISSDGQNLASLGDVPAGTHAFDLGHVSLPAGTYTLFVKATGKPSIQNKMSPPLAFRPADQPPAAALAVTQTGNMTFKASTVGSADPDGTIASSQIDFGDGTVVHGSSASHAYAAIGTYSIVATVTDNLGASAVVIKQVTAKPAAPGVTLVSPADGDTVNWPTSLLASANLPGGTARMNVYVDGQIIYAAPQDNINTKLKIMTGTHQVTVQAFDAAGGSASATANVTAEPGDLPPVPLVTIQPMPSVRPLTVLACTVGSRDPDGFIVRQQITFSDGSVFTTPGVLHTFASAGTYSASVTATDQFGARATTVQSFTVW